MLNRKFTDRRDNFMGWQCRIRQIAMREGGGRPTTGMRPQLHLSGDESCCDEITVLLVRQDADRDASLLKHLFLKTQDSAERHESALEFLSATYYQRPREFSDELTGLFETSMSLAQLLLSNPDCVLNFSQFSASYRLPCTVRKLDHNEPAYQTTYWHNRLFNPNMPGRITILGFLPDWSVAEMDPT